MGNVARAHGIRLLLQVAVLAGVLALSSPATSCAQVAAVIVNVDSGLVDDVALDLLQRIYRGEKANVPGQRRKRYERLYLPLSDCGGFDEILSILYPPDFERNRKQAHVDGNVKRPAEVSFQQALEEVSKANTRAFAIVDAAAIEDGESSAGESSGGGRCQERGRLPDNVKVLRIDGNEYRAQDYPLRVMVKARTRG